MDEVNTYSGYVEVKPEDVRECEKAPWQLLIDTWLTGLDPVDKEIVLQESKYIIEVLEKEKENEKVR